MARKSDFSNELPPGRSLTRSGIGRQQLTCGGLRSRAQKRSLLIEHNVNRKMREQLLEFFFFAEGGEKFAALHFGQDFRSYAAGDEDAAARKRLQCQVA